MEPGQHFNNIITYIALSRTIPAPWTRHRSERRDIRKWGRIGEKESACVVRPKEEEGHLLGSFQQVGNDYLTNFRCDGSGVWLIWIATELDLQTCNRKGTKIVVTNKLTDLMMGNYYVTYLRVQEVGACNYKLTFRFTSWYPTLSLLCQTTKTPYMWQLTVNLPLGKLTDSHATLKAPAVIWARNYLSSQWWA